MASILLKNGFTEEEIKENIDYLFRVCTLQNFTKEIVLTASFIREKYSISYWDSIIVGSALIAKCDILVSEDMQKDLLIESKLIIKNIF